MKKANKANPDTFKSRLEWAILILLILAIAFGLWSNIFAYEYYYFKCQDKPTEVFGNYYRIPYDEGYGIHPGSDYSNCSYSAPPGKIRDPSTKAGHTLANPVAPKADFDLYIPDGYETLGLPVTGASGKETSFRVVTKSNVIFQVREMNKDSDFSYTNLCSKPAEGSWSGTIIGKDSEGRIICRTNPSKYIKDYIVGANIGRTGIMLQTANGSDELLNSEATAIFSSMKPYKN